MARTTRVPYARIAGDYYEDERIIEVGPLAEVLFVRLIAFSRRTLSDGFVSDSQLRRVASGIRGVPKLLASLQDHALVVQESGGVRVRNYARWNETRVEVEQEREAIAARQRAYRERRNGVSNALRDDAGNALVAPLEKSREEESREEKTTTTALARRAAAPVDRPENAGKLVAEWIDKTGEHPKRIVGQVSKELKTLLDEGIAYDRVRLGLAEWSRSNTGPSALASFVDRAGQRNGRLAGRSTTDDRVATAFALAEQYDRMEARA